jgi:hypothetical protein
VSQHRGQDGTGLGTAIAAERAGDFHGHWRAGFLAKLEEQSAVRERAR